MPMLTRVMLEDRVKKEGNRAWAAYLSSKFYVQKRTSRLRSIMNLGSACVHVHVHVHVTHEHDTWALRITCVDPQANHLCICTALL